MTDTEVIIRLEITPEAIARVKELGMEREFDEMLEHTKQFVPNLVAISADRYDDPWEPDDPRVRIEAEHHASIELQMKTWNEWGAWFVRRYPGAVCSHFGFSNHSPD